MGIYYAKNNMANLIKVCPVPFVFKKIFQDELDGLLQIKSSGITRKLYFEKGNLQFASSDYQGDRLGNILFYMGKIDKSFLATLNQMAINEGERIGKFLANKKFVDRHDLYDALVLQMKTISTSTFLLKTGEWEYSIKTYQLADDLKFNIWMPEIILAGINMVEDFSIYKKLFLYKSPITSQMPEDIKQLFPVKKLDFFKNLSQYFLYSNEQIIPHLKMGEVDYWKSIVSFYLLNLVDFGQYRVDEELNRKIEEINELYDRFQTEKLDSFEYFGLEDTIVSKNVNEVIDSIVNDIDPDSLDVPPDAEIRKKADYIKQKADLLTKTIYEKKDTKKHPQSTTGIKPIPKDDKSKNNQDTSSKKAKELYLEANTFYQQKRYHEAVNTLEKAIKLDSSKSSYLLLLGLSQAKIPSFRRIAETNLKKVAEMEPWNADPLFYLGELYKSEKLFVLADKYFRMALEINLDHTLVGGGIGKENQDEQKKSILKMFPKK